MGFFFFINLQCIFGTRLQSYRFCSKEKWNQWNCFSEFFMISSSVLVCQRTPQDTRLIIMCSLFVTRSVLLILSLSASLGVSDNLLGRKPQTCSELVYSAKRHLCRKAYWLLWECNLTVLKDLCGSEHIFQISKLRWFCVWMCMLHVKWVTSKSIQCY